MRNRRKFSVRANLALMGIAASLFLAGCSSKSNEQEGHQEPTLGTYLVMLDPIQPANLIADPSAPNPTRKIDLAVRCDGQNLPDDCDQNIPNWRVHQPAGTSFLEITIADPTQPRTTAMVTLNVAKYLATYKGEDNSVSEHWFMVGFIPSSTPEKLKLGGVRDIVVSTASAAPKDPKAPAEPRQEQPPDRPRSSVTPNRFFCIIRSLNDASATDSGVFHYSGPDTQITEASITGTGASKFAVITPTLPYALKGGSDATRVQVQFTADQLDLSRYDAILTISTANGASCNVLLGGQRQNF